VILVNGRYDVICPPINAYRLHGLLPNSRLVFAEGGGHWMGEKPVQRSLLEAMREFE
jgi:proline iminopeptidase